MPLHLKETVQIIPLGGLGEIGKNMTAIKYKEEIFIVDVGVSFPDAEMLGVESVIPNFDYIRKNKDKVKAVIITHAHEDHIGGLPYFLKEFQFPIYTTKLTAALIKNKLKNVRGVTAKDLNIINKDTILNLGSMKIEFFATNHSIPDCVGVVFKTALGSIVHTGDFKVDYAPLDKGYLDFQRLGEIGRDGVLAMLSDSTNAEKPGVSLSEKTVGENLKKTIQSSSGKVVIATFSSSLHRVQNIINIAHELGKKLLPLGRSMENNIKTASKLGYLNIPNGVLVTAKTVNKIKNEDLIVITTGAQGEPTAGLYRLAHDEIAAISLAEGDTVIFSSNAIPGNEKSVGKLVNKLLKSKVRVIQKGDIHTSGHGNQDEQKLMLSIFRPKYFIPVHGEYRMLIQHAKSAKDIGIQEENIVISENGDVIEINEEGISIKEKIGAEAVLIDSSGLGNVDLAMMRDRRRMANHGVAVINANITGEKVRVNAILKGIVAKYDKNTLNRALADKILLKIKEGKQIGKSKKELYDDFAEVIHKEVKRKPMIVFLFNIN